MSHNSRGSIPVHFPDRIAIAMDSHKWMLRFDRNLLAAYQGTEPRLAERCWPILLSVRVSYTRHTTLGPYRDVSHHHPVATKKAFSLCQRMSTRSVLSVLSDTTVPQIPTTSKSEEKTTASALIEGCGSTRLEFTRLKPPNGRRSCPLANGAVLLLCSVWRFTRQKGNPSFRDPSIKF